MSKGKDFKDFFGKISSETKLEDLVLQFTKMSDKTGATSGVSKAVKKSIKRFKKGAQKGEKMNLLETVSPMMKFFDGEPEVINMIENFQKKIDSSEDDPKILDSMEETMTNLGMDPMCFKLLKSSTVLADEYKWDMNTPDDEIKAKLQEICSDPTNNIQNRHRIILDIIHEQGAEATKWLGILEAMGKFSGSGNIVINKIMKFSLELPREEE